MTRWLAGVVVSLGLAVRAVPVDGVAAESVEVVVAAQPAVEEPLTVNALRAIFGMRLRTWPNGEPIRVFVLRDDHPLHTAFCKRVINIYPHQLRLAWDRLVFSGTGQAPISVATEEEMRAKVASTPGAIGYLRRSMIDGGVRTLPVQ